MNDRPEAVFVLALERGLPRPHRAAPEGTGVRNHAGAPGARWRRAAFARVPRRQPAALVPVLEHGQRMLRQSLAILEYLDEILAGPALLPATARERQRVRALAQLVACDIHPLNNLRVLQYFERANGACRNPERDGWVRHWIVARFDAFESMLAEHPSTGTFCDGNNPSIADCCLVPQALQRAPSAWRSMPTRPCCGSNAECLELPAFQPRGRSASRTPRPPSACRASARTGPLAGTGVEHVRRRSCSPLAPSDRRNFSARPSRESAASSASSVRSSRSCTRNRHWSKLSMPSSSEASIACLDFVHLAAAQQVADHAAC